jgi:methyl coenzyme M reductase subunit C-like uncharacterized protein (methanogenesis marker protein 7)
MAKLELELLIKDAQAASSVGDIRKQLKDLKSAMLTVGEDSEEFNKLAQAAASLKDRVEEANEKIESMNPDKFKGLNQMASGAATGIQLATASMSLLGVESEDAQKAMMRVQAAMAFAQAINDIDKLKKGFQAFNAAVSANPIVAVTLALVALGTAIYKVWSAQQDANSELAKATREYEKQEKITASLSREYEREISLLTAQGESEEKIIAVKRKLIDTQMLKISQSITMHKNALQEIDDNDSLWESLIKVSAAVNGGTQAQINADLVIAQNKKERKAEEIAALNEQEEALKDLQNEILILDAEETKIAEKKKEDNVKAYVDKKAIKDQEALDNEAAWAKALEDNQAFIDATNAQEESRNEMLSAHDQHRLEMYQADRKAKEDAYKKAHDYKKKLDEIERKREEQMAKDKIDFAKNVLGTLSVLMKDNADAQKAISAATTLIDTYAAAQSAFKAASASPITTAFPAYPFIQAGLAVVSGLARVAAIMRVDTSGASASSGGGGASAGGGGSLTVSSQPNVSSGSQPSTLLTEQGNVANQQSQNPIYVSVEEIRQTSNDVQTIEERSRF